MSAESVNTILTRAMSDQAFADSLFANMDQVLRGFDLTPEEFSKFKGMSRADFGKYAAASPEERKSMWGSGLSAGI
jgi:hypothetical protein